jgi:hypothetical protein
MKRFVLVISLFVVALSITLLVRQETFMARPSVLNPEPFITKEQALMVAHRVEPRTQAATSVSIQPGNEAPPELLALAQVSDQRNIWIIRFDGIENVSSGPPQAVRKVSHTLYVVIDARTGRFIKSFTHN